LYFIGNYNLSDFCGIKPLLNANGVVGQTNISDNLYNPTEEDIITGNCFSNIPVSF
jgi:hypothetical protein